MNIHGKLVLLRALEPEDNEMLLSLLNDPNTEYMVDGASFPQSLSRQQAWLAAQTGDTGTLRCAVVPFGEKKAVGTVILSDIDYRNGNGKLHIKLLPEGRGKGYGSDAILAVCSYAFKELRLHSVYAHVVEPNELAHKLFRGCGFRKDGILRDRVFKRGDFLNCAVYSLVNDNT